MKRFLTVLLCVVLLLEPAALRAAPQAGREESGQEESGGTDSGETAATDGPQVGAPSVFLAEASTGKMVYEKNADERRPPASVTKVMTLVLMFGALAEGGTGGNSAALGPAGPGVFGSFPNLFTESGLRRGEYVSIITTVRNQRGEIRHAQTPAAS